MKKICLILTCIILLFCSIDTVSADTDTADTGNTAGVIKVPTTEKVPGAQCSKDGDGWYICHVGTGFSSVTRLVWEMVKYFTYLTALAAVLFIVINGILYSMAGINEWLKNTAKDRIIKTLIGLVILLLVWVILNAIAPWIYVA